MKRIYIARLLCVVLLGLWSCEKEEKITPEGPGSLLTNFDFPQGNDPWDAIFQEIYDTHNVKIIYKDFTDENWSHVWTPYQLGAPVTGDRFETAEELTEVANYMKKYLFDFLDPSATRGVFRRYIYLIKDMKVADLPTKMVTGIDCWMFSPPVGVNVTSSYTNYVYAPKIKIFSDILATAFKNGNISLPASFYEGIDYTTETVWYTFAYTNNNWANLWCRRGFLGSLLESGRPDFPDLFRDRNVPIAEMRERPDEEFVRFVGYALALRDIDRYFANGCRFEQSPKLQTRLHIVIDHLKSAYGIDLLAYQAIAYEGYTGTEWEGTDYQPAIPQ
ncbi:MAG: hypothetical protein LBI96_08090 [Odoribacteraceae bacterium]|jgi:hypothetical protein|nr:hypothetical protein [Odoribacteraceae bacterium]